jgi:hypothetical protein
MSEERLLGANNESDFSEKNEDRIRFLAFETSTRSDRDILDQPISIFSSGQQPFYYRT